MDRRLVVLALVPLALVACSSAPERSTAPGATATSLSSSATSSATSSGGPPITVKDAFTAVTVSVIGGASQPVLGTDKKYHVVYEVELVNASPVPATITRFDVLDARDEGRVLVSYQGPKLVDPTCKFGDCNRLRELPASPASTTTIPPQEGRVLFVDFTFDSLDGAPKDVVHRFVGTGADRPGKADPVPLDYVVAPHNISGGTPVTIGPPLKGKHWIALNGCCEPGWPHRSSVASFNGELFNPQRFAIDWKQVDDKGAAYNGDKTKNESYVDYGSEVIAVADATVVATLDRLDPNPPGILPAADPELSKLITVETVDGNHIVLDLGNGVYAFYAHLLKGSLTVKPGDKVKKGQTLAKLGNTGNSNASHLHLHLMDSPSVLGSNGLPYVIDSFGYDGAIDPQVILDADDYLTGTFFGPGRLATVETRTNELPLAWSLVDFPG